MEIMHDTELVSYLNYGKLLTHLFEVQQTIIFKLPKYQHFLAHTAILIKYANATIK